MSGSLPASPAAVIPPQGEPLVPHAKLPGKIELHLPNLASLFDTTAPPSYPHTGPMLEKGVAKFLLDSVRAQRKGRSFEVVLALDSPPLPVDTETAARSHFSRFFANEAEGAMLEVRVNREEGFGSLRYAVPLVALGLLIAGVFYFQMGGDSGQSYLLTLSYLVFITIVWVMLWDPLEVLLFDSFFLRRRVHALRTLAQARVTFVYSRPGA